MVFETTFVWYKVELEEAAKNLTQHLKELIPTVFRIYVEVAYHIWLCHESLYYKI